jgi:AraC family transcriptional regulator of adaptative response / DNA-3-methyladenine glycosylase II
VHGVPAFAGVQRQLIPTARCPTALSPTALSPTALSPTALFPTAQALAGCDPTSLPMPRARARCIVAFAEAVADRQLVLDAGSDWREARSALLGLAGVGVWTADYILMRALGDPDVFLAGDLGIRKALATLRQPLDPARTAPWRSYLSHHLWASLSPDPPSSQPQTSDRREQS